MNILYYSVHHVLEDDEVRLFQRLGHNVVCLGLNGLHGVVQPYRPGILFNEEEKTLYRYFYETGGAFSYGKPPSEFNISKEFMAYIDVTIIMHDYNFLSTFWDVLRVKPVVWRAIGQGVEEVDHILQSFRAAGLLIVRYSPIETENPQSLGQDVLIRFGKSGDFYNGWSGSKQQILTFANSFKQRYPLAFDDFMKITDGLPTALAGGSNESENSIGWVTWEQQIELLRVSSAYLYVTGQKIPYTLNFIEAWMCGIPVVVFSPLDRQGPYFEIDRLITDGVDGFVCRTIEQARQRLSDLLRDEGLRRRIGHAGRQAALALFDERKIEQAWTTFLLHVATMCPPRDAGLPMVTPVPEVKTQMASTSLEVFEVLSLLKPFDIDIPKIYVGGERDGGYVLADNFTSDNDVISFGVGADVSFEMDMAGRGHRSFMHDHTVEGPPQHHRLFHFEKVGVGGQDDPAANLRSLESCLGSAGELSNRLLLKMDIEGHEWDVFSQISEVTLARFDQIVMEVHWLNNLISSEFLRKVQKSLQNLNRQFTIFHVHANNCAGLSIIEGMMVADVLELSFVRTSLVRRRPSQTIYPSALNKANHPNFSDYKLLFFPFLPISVPNENIAETVMRVDYQYRFSL